MVNTSNVLTEDSVPNSFDIAGFELGVSRSRNAIHFSIIAILSKSHFTIVANNFFCKTRKNTRKLHLYCLGSCLYVK